jgi:hypothetical protein
MRPAGGACPMRDLADACVWVLTLLFVGMLLGAGGPCLWALLAVLLAPIVIVAMVSGG